MTRSRQRSGPKCRQDSMLSRIVYWVLHKIGGESMVDLYVALIIAGRRTITQVPSRFQAAVRDDLTALGLDETGQPVAA